MLSHSETKLSSKILKCTYKFLHDYLFALHFTSKFIYLALMAILFILFEFFLKKKSAQMLLLSFLEKNEQKLFACSLCCAADLTRKISKYKFYTPKVSFPERVLSLRKKLKPWQERIPRRVFFILAPFSVS